LGFAIYKKTFLRHRSNQNGKGLYEKKKSARGGGERGPAIVSVAKAKKSLKGP